ncbi:MAG: isoleucine--tRNA ligase [Oscillospiraceae bacterium]|jgi:isoleucyl-tRNA synthetase|nr:isoleucine--tRNA ligase [Oscillospiraceae bacterium]
MDYNNTLNLPKTDFPMRGNLPKREPEILAKWDEERKYYQLVEKNKGKKPYILHDGPPYANGDIHLGTALNKILKDIIVKHKTMSGHYAPYVPGWDCHGLPIELKAQKSVKGVVSVKDLRKYCREFALSCLDGQKKQFKRLGVWGDFNNPYVTIAPDFEARQVEIFGEMYKKGYIYKGLKPVHWCAGCQTALAEAEIEYHDDDCTSIYVKFPILDTPENRAKLNGLNIDIAKAYAVIWTTTTWTLPGNLAISVNPAFEYGFVEVNGEYLLLAKSETDTVIADAALENARVLPETITGKELELLETSHPFLPRKSPVICGNHVTGGSGTGLVHTAPGFGVEDYEVCNQYKGLFEIIVPVDEKGRLTDIAGENVSGKTTNEANKIILADLKDKGLLLSEKLINHSYPHCWRCHDPIIYRATSQWFCSVDKFTDVAVKAIHDTKWLPSWGLGRIENMVTGRSDWCISRQRRWGVPIPVLYCKDCGEVICNDDTIKATAELFRVESSDAWYDKDPKDFLPDTVKCKCGCTEFVKENDIFDVWFDSGCSYAAVVEQRDELNVHPSTEPQADLYLEGADQYRGWFQSSLLTSSAVYGRAPYKAVLTHGWVVDGQGRQMHKSLGNSILPEQIVDKYGADILRLWVVSSDYHADIRVSDDMVKQISEVYRKIRNTARFMLSNLYDFNPDTDSVPTANLDELDKYALIVFNKLIDDVKDAYESTDFYKAYKAVNEFCVTDMSGLYLDIIKDRLYCETSDKLPRRSAQTALYTILSGFTRLIAPIIAFTSEEIWEYLPHAKSDDTRGVLFNDFPDKTIITGETDITDKWNCIRQIRDDVLAALEIKRAEKVIGKPLEAIIELYTTDEETYDRLIAYNKTYAQSFIVSKVTVNKGTGEYTGQVPNLTVTVKNAATEGLHKCERCWTYTETENICARCAAVVGDIK